MTEGTRQMTRKEKTRNPSTLIAGRVAYPRPAYRRFRVFAFDPLVATDPQTADFNKAIVSIPWEEAWEEPLDLGPSGEYFEVIDFDPASGVFYAPLDPNDPLLLAQDGLPPSEGRPQFHQQMVYAVAMKTVRNFERALGRKVLWSNVQAPPPKPQPRSFDSAAAAAAVPATAPPPGAPAHTSAPTAPDHGYIQKLRLYPHAMQEQNAFYSPNSKAILFGYFRAQDNPGGRSLPGGWVFTCLSQDVIAHETTHAILDGLHDRFIEPSSPDTLAFHEAFADLVAIFQHFTQREPLLHALAAHRGVLDVQSLLTGLAQQFGDARDHGGGALRQAVATLGAPSKSGAYLAETDPHSRGAFLVQAVFDAFLILYERRTADLFRIAGDPVGTTARLSPDVVARLAEDATSLADQVLQICVRALDYVPPIDLRFGEFLRALVTADADLVSDDPLGARVAIAEAFRRRGIFPQGVASMAPDSLTWESPDPEPDGTVCSLPGELCPTLDLQPLFGRQAIWDQARENGRAVHRWLMSLSGPEQDRWAARLGVKLRWDSKRNTVSRRRDRQGNPLLTASGDPDPAVEVHSVRMARRIGPNGEDLRQLVIEITQRRDAYDDEKAQADADAGRPVATRPDFAFRGGATIIVDLRDNSVRYIVRKRIDDDARLVDQRKFRTQAEGVGLAMTYAATARSGLASEPFALLHGS